MATLIYKSGRNSTYICTCNFSIYIQAHENDWPYNSKKINVNDKFLGFLLFMIFIIKRK